MGDTSETTSAPAGNSENWNIALNVGLPLYQGGALKAQEQKAGYELNAAAAELLQAQRSVDTGISTAYRSLQALNLQAEALAAAVLASESALEARQEGFDAGITTNLDVLDAQRSLFSARNDYLNARYSALLAGLNLERAAGTLGEAGLESVNRRLAQ